jgi:hypothetical protein
MAPWLREAVVRGDVAAAGLVLVFAGAVLGAVWLSGAGALPGLLAIGLLPTGAATVWWARRAYGRLLAEVVRAWAGHDPGPSPVAWISDEVWRQRNRFDPELDAADELRSQVDRSVRPYRDAAQGAFESPTLRPVSDAERGLAAAGAPSAAPPPPSGPADELLAALRGTPGRFIGVGVRWPVCCGHLAVLVAVGPASGPERAWSLRDGPGDDAVDLTQHGFRCAVCGRAWRTTPTW